jgi:hypothetical protein
MTYSVFEVLKSGEKRLVTSTTEELSEADALMMCCNNGTELYRDEELIFSSGPLSRRMFHMYKHSPDIGMNSRWGKPQNYRKKKKRRFS